MTGQVSLWRAFVAVFWGFLGVRSEAGYKSDITRLSFGQIAAVGIFCTLLFIATLVGVVYLVTHNA